MNFDYCSLKGVRSNNQDSVMFASVINGQMDVKFIHHDQPDDYAIETVLPNGTWISIVADGMGGLSNGEKASFLTISMFLDNLEEMYSADLDMEELIYDIICKTSQSVRTNSPDSGSTIVGCMYVNEKYYLFNVGDSIFLAFDGNNILRSEAHSLSDESHIITDFIGMEKSPNVHFYQVTTIKSLMMFSDGMDNLLDEYGDNLIFSEMTSHQLCQDSMMKGSQDNITCLKVKI